MPLLRMQDFISEDNKMSKAVNPYLRYYLDEAVGGTGDDEVGGIPPDRPLPVLI